MTDRVVDIHSHITPRSYIDLLKARTEFPLVVQDGEVERLVPFPNRQGRVITDDDWDVERKVQYMDRFGIATSVVSLGNPILDPFNGVEAAGIARQMNAELSQLEGDTGGRLVGMGVLPQYEIAAAAETVAEIASTAGLHGVVTGPTICGMRFNSPHLEPVWEVLNATRIPVLLHPQHSDTSQELEGFGDALPVSLGFPFQTTAAVAQLAFAGVLERFPDIRLVASHGGGSLPFLAARLDAVWRSYATAQERVKTPPSQQLSLIYLDVVVFHDRAMKAAADLVGPSQLCFGTDHPFAIADPEGHLNSIDRLFDGDDRAAVLSTTADNLFGLLDAESS